MQALLLAALLGLALTQTLGSLKFVAPQDWKVRAPASSMRVAEFIVPRAQGDPEDAEVIVYFFGGGGGSVDANIERWVGQFEQESGAAAKPGDRSTFSVGTLKVTSIDVSGTYVAEMSPGSEKRFNKPRFRMRAAVVETPRGPYFIKFTGPRSTVTQGLPSFEAFLKSLTFS